MTGTGSDEAPRLSNDQKVERFVRWFLRFNGYFGIENFVVHAADDPLRISDGIVAPHTETDTLGIRMPYSEEIAGTLRIANFPQLVDGATGRFDVVIAEAKSGNENRPNKVWRNGITEPVEYLTRFVGLCNSEEEIRAISSRLLSHFSYEDKRSRFRYIVFSSIANEHYGKSGVTYLVYEDLVRFLVTVRGQCWIEANIGTASVHYQWDPFINRIFDIANDSQNSTEERCTRIIRELLEP